MGEVVEYVDLSVPEGMGLWRLVTSSTSVYYIDARVGFPPRMLRAAGEGDTSVCTADWRWVRLLALKSGPKVVDGDRQLAREDVDFDDMRPWVVRVGSRHRYEWETMLTYDYITQRVLERIERLEEMPPTHLLTRTAADDDQAAGRDR